VEIFKLLRCIAGGSTRHLWQCPPQRTHPNPSIHPFETEKPTHPIRSSRVTREFK